MDAAVGALDDLDHGGGPGLPVPGGDGDGQADELVRQGGGVTAERSPPGAIGELLGIPARERRVPLAGRLAGLAGPDEARQIEQGAVPVAGQEGVEFVPIAGAGVRVGQGGLL